MRREIFMASRGYYVAIHILTVWKRLARLAPDQPHGWTFPDEFGNFAYFRKNFPIGIRNQALADDDTGAGAEDVVM